MFGIGIGLFCFVSLEYLESMRVAHARLFKEGEEKNMDAKLFYISLAVGLFCELGLRMAVK